MGYEIMSQRSVHVKIPLERVGVLIGPDGRIKRVVEKKLLVNIEIDSPSGDVELSSRESDPSLLLRARDIVLAIGRGFSPERAFNLFKEDSNLYVIDLRELFATPSDIQRVKSRIIGKAGKTRRIIEEETMTKVSVYGHTVSIIGDVEHMEVAKEAIDMLIRGNLHRNVYRYLDTKRSELKKIEMEIWKPTSEILKGEVKKGV